MAETQPGTSPGLPLGNYYWVRPGELLAGEHPTGANADETRRRLVSLVDAGIDCFIDLTTEPERPAYAAELPAAVSYYRHPLPDHGVPGSREEMTAILGRLRRALGEGRRVYLHCRAGIGRTGMTVGCLLAEEGASGEGALEELNRLWQQSPRSRQWPSVPETEEQAAYVRTWSEADPLLEPATLEAARGLRERFRGALLGLATGDAVGAATQYRRPGRFTPVGDLLGGGPFDLPRGAWSDDTAMALCLAESLLEQQGFDARDQVMRYRRWQQEGHLSATGSCLGISAGTARALARSQWRRQSFSGSHDPQALDPEPLSRVAPVVLFYFADPERAVAQAAQAARTTCQAAAVLEACRVLARALLASLRGASRREILAAAGRGTGGGAAAAEGSAAAALESALRVFADTDSFRDAVLAAANLGGPADVVTAITGALAGAHYRAASIPATWRNSLMRRELLEDFADRLLAQALLQLGG